MHVDIVSAEAEIYSGTVNMVFAPAMMGEVGIAARHAPMITRLKAGSVRVQPQGGEEQSFYVSGGMLEVQPHVVTVLADVAQRAEDLDEQAAMEAKKRAEDAMAGQEGELTYEEAHAQLTEAMAKLEVIRHLKDLKHGRSRA